MIAVSDVMSDMLYQRALAFERAFTLAELVPGANQERRQVARVWLNQLIERGELVRTKTDGRYANTWYEWVNL